MPSDWLDDYDRRTRELEARNPQEDAMPIIAANSGGSTEFEKLPEGVHMAVCDMLVNLGEQKDEWSGKIKYKPKVYIRFQVPSERVEIDGEDKPMIIGEVFTLSLNEKSKLRPLLESWRGRGFTAEELQGFDISKLLSVPCQISVTHNTSESGKTYANIKAIMPIPKGMEPPKLEGSPVLYEGPESDCFDKLPKWLQEKIDSAPADFVPANNGAPFNDEVPF